jgi:glycosyltransferase involved in cell wall biosynthesis
MRPLVSILVPCFNAAPWLTATLESALNQTWARCEIIVVNDGSTDNSEALLEPFRHRGVVVLSQPNRGASAARNRALEHATGDLIQFLDADDLLASDKVERQIATLSAAGPRHVASGPWARFHGDVTSARFTPEPVWRDLSAVDFLIECALGELMFPPLAWLVPRALCDAAGPWDGSLSLNDDGEYMSRVLAHSDGIRFSPEARAYYRSGNPLSYGSRRSRGAAESELRAWDGITATLRSLDPGDRSALAAATGYQRFQANYYPEFSDLIAQAAAKERALGGGRYRFQGGRLYQAAVRTLGWKAALRGRRLAARFRQPQDSGSAQ